MYKNDPRLMTAKFNSTCPKCKLAIRKGDRITYWPSERKAYHPDCCAADYSRFLDSARDEAMYSGTPFDSHDFGDNY